MPSPPILVASWGNGLFSVIGEKLRQELTDRPVRSLVGDRNGSVLAIVGKHSLCRRSCDGEWAEIATSEFELSCCVRVGESIFAGTDDAHVLRFDADGSQHRVTGFDAVAGRDDWYAGAAIVDGRLMGPPLGVRSMAVTCDNEVLLANVHVGGLPRSSDSGRTWRPTIDIHSDVHQVCAHPRRPEIVIAAAAAGLCISRDSGSSWTIEKQGLHAHYCSAVAFGRNDIFVAASSDHFSQQGAVYRRSIDGNGPLRPLAGGMPEWMDGIADTHCIATRDSMVAVIDRSGCLYVSSDDGATWSCPIERLAGPSGLHIC